MSLNLSAVGQTFSSSSQLGTGVSSLVRGTGRAAWILFLQQPSNTKLRIAVNLLRVAALTQAVLSSVAIRLALHDLRREKTFHKWCSIDAAKDRLLWSAFVPFYGIWTSGKYLIQRSSESFNLNGRRKQEVARMQKEFNQISKGKNVQLLWDSPSCAILNAHKKEDEPRLYSVKDLVDESEDATFSIVSGLEIMEFAPAQVGLRPADKIFFVGTTTIKDDTEQDVIPDLWLYDHLNQVMAQLREETEYIPLANSLVEQNPPPPGGQNYMAMATTLEYVAHKVKKALEQGKKVIVHCAADQNRSASVAAVALYLMYKDNLKLTMEQALWIVLKGRGIANPNPSYLWILYRMEAFLQSKMGDLGGEDLLPLFDANGNGADNNHFPGFANLQPGSFGSSPLTEAIEKCAHNLSEENLKELSDFCLLKNGGSLLLHNLPPPGADNEHFELWQEIIDILEKASSQNSPTHPLWQALRMTPDDLLTLKKRAGLIIED